MDSDERITESYGRTCVFFFCVFAAGNVFHCVRDVDYLDDPISIPFTKSFYDYSSPSGAIPMNIIIAIALVRGWCA